MNLLSLPVDIWASYVMPLVDLSSNIRLAGCSRASANLTRQTLERAPPIAIVAPSDLYACLTWLRSSAVCIDRLIIDSCHETALAAAKMPRFYACFREIALKYTDGNFNISAVNDNELLILLHQKLAVLEIEAPSVKPATIMEDCLGCQNIHSITYVMKWHSEGCDEAWLVKMIRANLGLRKLHIGQDYSFVKSVFDAIAERKDTLTDVTIWIGSSNTGDFHDREHDQLRRIFKSCSSLRTLTYWIDRGAAIDTDELVGMENKCPHLEELTFHNMAFSGDSLLNFVLSCPKLRVCHVDCGGIADHDFERWHRRGWPKLHDFDLHWAVEQLETVVACAEVFEEVRTYHMHCSAPSWQTAVEALVYMPHLHTVCLYSHHASVLPYLPRYCPQLRVLRLIQEVVPKCTREIGEALIAALPGLPKLEELQWELMSDFGEAGLMAVAQHCPNLRSLDCECEDVTDAGLIALVRGCRALSALVLSCCCQGWVTDAFLHAIARYCPHLAELRILPGWRAPLFSPAALTEVIVACPHLRVLHVPRNLKGGVRASALVVPAGRLRRLAIKGI